MNTSPPSHRSPFSTSDSLVSAPSVLPLHRVVERRLPLGDVTRVPLGQHLIATNGWVHGCHIRGAWSTTGSREGGIPALSAMGEVVRVKIAHEVDIDRRGWAFGRVGSTSAVVRVVPLNWVAWSGLHGARKDFELDWISTGLQGWDNVGGDLDLAIKESANVTEQQHRACDVLGDSQAPACPVW